MYIIVCTRSKRSCIFQTTTWMWSILHNINRTAPNIQFQIYHFQSSCKPRVIHCPPLNRITLGQYESDSNNRMIKLPDIFCVLLRYILGPVVSDYNKRPILLSVIQLCGGHSKLFLNSMANYSCVYDNAWQYALELIIQRKWKLFLLNFLSFSQTVCIRQAQGYCCVEYQLCTDQVSISTCSPKIFNISFFWI